MTYIEIEYYGDFSVVQTMCIMYHEEKKDINALTSEFCSINNLPMMSDLPANDLYNITKKFEIFLKEKGFKKLNTHKIIFND